MAPAEFEHVESGLCGHVHEYDVFVSGDSIRVVEDGVSQDPGRASTTVDGLAEFVAGAEDLRLSWGRFPDGAEVIYIYDLADDCFGYGFNLSMPPLSEWGYAPVRGRKA